MRIIDKNSPEQDALALYVAWQMGMELEFKFDQRETEWRTHTQYDYIKTSDIALFVADTLRTGEYKSKYHRLLYRLKPKE